jgi:4a-hydroxytetrahydrobiopterin dehydratase
VVRITHVHLARTERVHGRLGNVPDPENEKRLDEAGLASLLTSSKGWSREGNALTKTFTFKGFKGAMAFVNRVAEAANAANHHPDIHLEAYKTVRVVLTTHLTGGISDADVELAKQIDRSLDPRNPAAT